MALISASCTSTNKSVLYRVTYDFNKFIVCGHNIFLSTQDVQSLKNAVTAAFPSKELSSVTVISKRSVNVELRESATHWKKYHFIKRNNSWTLDHTITARDVWY